MTDLAEPQLAGAWQDADWTKRRLRRRYRAERRFKAYRHHRRGRSRWAFSRS